MPSRLKRFLKNIEYLCKYNIQNLAQREAWLVNMPYEILDRMQNQEIQLPKIADRFETLSIMIEEKKSVTRYGDGEFNLAQNISIPFQEASPRLSERLQKILKSNPAEILICLPDVFGSLDQYTAHSQTFWRSYLKKHRSDFYLLIILENQYYDAFVSRPFIGLADRSKCGAFYDEFKKVWNNRNVVVIEGAETRMGIGNDLLDNAKSVKRIIAPALNAFEKYAELLTAATEQPKGSLFLLCLGPTATVLAYDLAQAGYQAIDSGHLDIEYEWFLRKATDRVKVEGKYVLEVAGGPRVTNGSNTKYESEVIAQL